MRSLIIALIFSGCSSSDFDKISNFVSGDTSEAFYKQQKAVESGDIKAIRDSLANKKLSEENRYRLLAMALSSEDCGDSAVSEILKNNGDPIVFKKKGIFKVNNPEFHIVEGEINGSAVLVGLASRNFCTESILKLSPLISDKDFAVGMNGGYFVPPEYQSRWKGSNLDKSISKSFSAYLNANFGPSTFDDSEESERNKRISSFFSVAVKRVKEVCDSKKIIEACEFVESLKGYVEKSIAQLDVERANKEYMNSPQALNDKACELRAEIKELELQIKEEREKGKISGYVNAVSLKTWGDRIYDLRQAVRLAISEYKKRTSKGIVCK